MKSIAQIAAELQGYDPQALSADQVSAFLERLALPVTATEELGIFEALGRVPARAEAWARSGPPHRTPGMAMRWLARNWWRVSRSRCAWWAPHWLARPGLALWAQASA